MIFNNYDVEARLRCCVPKTTDVHNVCVCTHTVEWIYNIYIHPCRWLSLVSGGCRGLLFFHDSPRAFVPPRNNWSITCCRNRVPLVAEIACDTILGAARHFGDFALREILLTNFLLTFRLTTSSGHENS